MPPHPSTRRWHLRHLHRLNQPATPMALNYRNPTMPVHFLSHIKPVLFRPASSQMMLDGLKPFIHNVPRKTVGPDLSWPPPIYRQTGTTSRMFAIIGSFASSCPPPPSAGTNLSCPSFGHWSGPTNTSMNFPFQNRPEHLYEPSCIASHSSNLSL